MRAQWTYDPEAVAYYFAPLQASAPPYNTREVKAILDIASDGTLAGIELVEMGTPLPPPPLAMPPAAQPVDPHLAAFLRTQAKVERANDNGIWELLEEAADAISALSTAAAQPVAWREALELAKNIIFGAQHSAHRDRNYAKSSEYQSYIDELDQALAVPAQPDSEEIQEQRTKITEILKDAWEHVDHINEFYITASWRIHEWAASLTARPESAEVRFHGAQCPSYPYCTGGCGLGCTHEIERNRIRCESAEMRMLEVIASEARDFLADMVGGAAITPRAIENAKDLIGAVNDALAALHAVPDDQRATEDMTLAHNVRRAAIEECARYLDAEGNGIQAEKLRAAFVHSSEQRT